MVRLFLVISACLLLLQCFSSISNPESPNYKGTILYFKGGSGKIVRTDDNKHNNTRLINRCLHLFSSKGFKIAYKPFNFSSTSSRHTNEHFEIIQNKVFDLISSGHKNIWLMGISNGGISVMHAGERRIQGVEGIVLINSAGSNHRLKEIQLPILFITHENDGFFPNYLPENFHFVCPNSARSQLSIFTGGLIANSIEGKRASQKYQHGLRGLENDFVDTVINFILTTPQTVDYKTIKTTIAQIEKNNIYRNKKITESDRFVRNIGSGIVYDKLTGLEWLIGPDKDMSWKDTTNWINKLNESDETWRIPSKDELMRLYIVDRGGEVRCPFLMGGYSWIWSESKNSMSSACVMFFGNGGWTYLQKDESNSKRAFAVRK